MGLGVAPLEESSALKEIAVAEPPCPSASEIDLSEDSPAFNACRAAPVSSDSSLDATSDHATRRATMDVAQQTGRCGVASYQFTSPDRTYLCSARQNPISRPKEQDRCDSASYLLFTSFYHTDVCLPRRISSFTNFRTRLWP